MTRRHRAFLVALALLAAAPRAGAEDREASRTAFRKGVTLAKDNDWKGARDAFLEAYRLFSHPSILLNIGIARWKIGEYVGAEQDLTKFLGDDRTASIEDVESARAALAQVKQHL